MASDSQLLWLSRDKTNPWSGFHQKDERGKIQHHLASSKALDAWGCNWTFVSTSMSSEWEPSPWRSLLFTGLFQRVWLSVQVKVSRLRDSGFWVCMCVLGDVRKGFRESVIPLGTGSHQEVSGRPFHLPVPLGRYVLMTQTGPLSVMILTVLGCDPVITFACPQPAWPQLQGLTARCLCGSPHLDSSILTVS